MRLSVRHQLLIAAVATTVFFVNLGATRLWDQDEAFFGRAAVEMHQRHEWVVPYFNDELFAHKPPMMFWLMRIGFAMFGVTEFAARFWSAIFGVATALLTYHLGRRLFNETVGLWAGLAMATALMFDVVARAATPDSFLVFFCTLALYLFARQENWQDVEANPTPPALSWRTWASIYAVMGLAVLVKGPIGILLPGAALGVYLLVRDAVEIGPVGNTIANRIFNLLNRNTPKAIANSLGNKKTSILIGTFLIIIGPWFAIFAFVGLYLLTHNLLIKSVKALIKVHPSFGVLRYFAPSRILRTVWQMRPLTAIGAVLLVAGPWFALVGWRTHGEFLREFFGTQNFGRFVNAMDNHSGGVWYYIPAILAGFFPWSIFGIPVTIDLIRRSRGQDQNQRGAKFLACWITVFVGFFSLASTKLPNYVLPVYPALALATACFLDRWLVRPASVNRWWPRLSFGSLLLVGIAIAVFPPLIAYGKIGGHPIIERLGIAPELRGDLALVGLLGAILIVGGTACLLFSELQRRRLAAMGLAISAITFSLALLAGIAVRIDQYQPCPAIAEAIRAHAAGKPQVGQFGYVRPSLTYYTDTRVETCKTAPSIVEFLSQSTDSFVVTTDEHYAGLKEKLPADVTIVARQPEFPRSGEVLVLHRGASIVKRTDGLQR